MSWQDKVANDPSLQSFTATGRPIPHPKDSAQGRGWNGMAVAEALGQGAPNLLPFKFTDDSIISIPVLPPQDFSETKLADSDDDEYNDSLKTKPKGRMSFFRRKSSSSTKKDKKGAFIMKDVTRADYLKYYAKDEKGNYIGTSDPAPDCILNSEQDKMKYRKGVEVSVDLSGKQKRGSLGRFERLMSVSDAMVANSSLSSRPVNHNAPLGYPPSASLGIGF